MAAILSRPHCAKAYVMACTDRATSYSRTSILDGISTLLLQYNPTKH